MFKLLSLLFGVMLFVSACASPKTHSGEPEWVLNPNPNGKIGAIGVAGRTYDQHLSTQRKLAITRALDELSLQKGVEVHLSMQKREQATADKSSLSLNENNSYTTNNSITAHVQDTWMDTKTDQLYVWMLLDKE